MSSYEDIFISGLINDFVTTCPSSKKLLLPELKTSSIDEAIFALISYYNASTSVEGARRFSSHILRSLILINESSSDFSNKLETWLASYITTFLTNPTSGLITPEFNFVESLLEDERKSFSSTSSLSKNFIILAQLCPAGYKEVMTSAMRRLQACAYYCTNDQHLSAVINESHLVSKLIPFLNTASLTAVFSETHEFHKPFETPIFAPISAVGHIAPMRMSPEDGKKLIKQRLESSSHAFFQLLDACFSTGLSNQILILLDIAVASLSVRTRKDAVEDYILKDNPLPEISVTSLALAFAECGKLMNAREVDISFLSNKGVRQNLLYNNPPAFLSMKDLEHVMEHPESFPPVRSSKAVNSLSSKLLAYTLALLRVGFCATINSIDMLQKQHSRLMYQLQQNGINLEELTPLQLLMNPGLHRISEKKEQLEKTIEKFKFLVLHPRVVLPLWSYLSGVCNLIVVRERTIQRNNEGISIENLPTRYVPSCIIQALRGILKLVNDDFKMQESIKKSYFMVMNFLKMAVDSGNFPDHHPPVKIRKWAADALISLVTVFGKTTKHTNETFVTSIINGNFHSPHPPAQYGLLLRFCNEELPPGIFGTLCFALIESGHYSDIHGSIQVQLQIVRCLIGLFDSPVLEQIQPELKALMFQHGAPVDRSELDVDIPNRNKLLTKFGISFVGILLQLLSRFVNELLRRCEDEQKKTTATEDEEKQKPNLDFIITLANGVSFPIFTLSMMVFRMFPTMFVEKTTMQDIISYLLYPALYFSPATFPVLLQNEQARKSIVKVQWLCTSFIVELWNTVSTTINAQPFGKYVSADPRAFPLLTELHTNPDGLLEQPEFSRKYFEEIYQNALQHMEEDEFSDIPDDFVDQLTYDPLVEPVELPFSKVVVNKSTFIQANLEREYSTDIFAPGQPVNLEDLKPRNDILEKFEEWKQMRRIKKAEPAPRPVERLDEQGEQDVIMALQLGMSENKPSEF
eukprot:gnl/Chilomastix_cuspidata/4393.p1 GENE.gnl/Chilomastix_cuspidata/4393~~gnl/Chilomastix_cuspidata/4393.p1  ORF type:complete len:988 (+),score=143.64 gnl/Chilomastix_cuspidata/4393:39-2966(+)